MCRTTIPLLVLLIPIIDAQFISNPDNRIDGCVGGIVDFNWTYNTSSPVFFLEWKVNGTRIAIEVLNPPQAFAPVGSYVGRLTNLSNAGVSLGSLSASDVGTYKCEITYTDNSGFPSDESILHVHDELNNRTEIKKTPGGGMVTLEPSIYDSSITYTWKLQGNVISTGSSYNAKLDGNYTLCVSGGRANCLNPAISSCYSIEVNGLNDCSLDIFLYGFLPDFLIVLIVSIVIIIILKIECLPKQFGGLTWKKLGTIAVCFVVAIIIGVCLGLLIKGCDNKLLALCLSLLFGILLVVALISALIYYHKKFESRRDIQDGGAQDGNGSSQNNTGSNTTRTTTERVGSPASTSNVELAANLKSEY